MKGAWWGRTTLHECMEWMGNRMSSCVSTSSIVCSLDRWHESASKQRGARRDSASGMTSRAPRDMTELLQPARFRIFNRT